MYRVRKTFKFEAAHILENAESRCCVACIHGHSYTAEVFLASEGLNGHGMVVDFGRISKDIGKLIDRWDHALFLPLLLRPAYLARAEELHLDPDKLLGMMGNPTAEKMAECLFKEINTNIMQKHHNESDAFFNVELEKVRIHETVTGWGEFSPSI